MISLAAAGALVALTAISTPATAGELSQNRGPVGPHEPILTTFGSKRIIAFYLPGSERCAVQAVVWDETGAKTDESAARVRISLEPGQIVHFDSAEQETLNLQCGSDAKNLSMVDNDELVAFGMMIHQSEQSMNANASGF